MIDLRKRFKEEILPKLQKELNIKNSMSAPRLSKIMVNMGIKDALTDKKSLGEASLLLMQITGQKPKVTKAKKSIATFKLREGDEIGLVVTIRGRRMYDFFEKIVAIVLPRLRDFHGVNRNSFDKRGNYSIGFYEHTVFPEIDSGRGERIRGVEVTIVTTAKDDKQGFALLEGLGMPFAHEQGKPMVDKGILVLTTGRRKDG